MISMHLESEWTQSPFMMEDTMEQSRLESLIEAVISTLIGFVCSYIGWPIAAHLTDLSYTDSQHTWIVLFFTILSVARGYVVRRWFNRLLKRAAERMASIISLNNP